MRDYWTLPSERVIRVTWIDNNSGCKGTCDRVNQFTIPEPIRAKWCQDKECFDDILIDSLKAYLATIPQDDNRPRLIVLHQMGSHGPAYYKRVPAQFKVFKPTCDTNAIQGCSRDALLNSYDNTLLYTDYVLDSLIETLKIQRNIKLLCGIYLIMESPQVKAVCICMVRLMRLHQRNKPISRC